MLSVFNTAQDVYTHTHMQVCAGRLECKGLHVCVHFGDAARSSKTSVECRGKYKSGTVRALGRRKKGEGQGGGGGRTRLLLLCWKVLKDGGGVLVKAKAPQPSAAVRRQAAAAARTSSVLHCPACRKPSTASCLNEGCVMSLQ